MDRTISLLLSISLACSLAFYSSCSGGAATDNLDEITGPSPTPSPTPSPSPGGGGTSSSFYIAVDDSVYDASHVHISSSFSTNCSIESSVTSNQDITCYIEMPESDVVYRDLPLVYHVPPDMCRYLVRRTYWFYNEEVGWGPSAININTYKTITEGPSGTTTTYSTNHDCTVDGVLDVGCNGQPEINTQVSSVDGSISLSCVYDRSDESRKSNCCFGEYTYTHTITTDLVQVSGTTTTSETTVAQTQEWGGEARNCIGGAGRTDWEFFDVNGFPAGVLTNVEDGIDETYTIKSPNSVQELENTPRSLHTANFYSTSGSVNHTHSGYVAIGTTSTKPYFIAPIDDRSGTSIADANESYDFSCMDSAFETIHRIRVFVREWDVRSDYDTYISSSGATVNPDRPTDNAPGDCVGLAGPCDDYWDNDDFLNLDLNLPAYDTTTLASRNLNFPYLIYK